MRRDHNNPTPCTDAKTLFILAASNRLHHGKGIIRQGGATWIAKEQVRAACNKVILGAVGFPKRPAPRWEGNIDDRSYNIAFLITAFITCTTDRSQSDHGQDDYYHDSCLFHFITSSEFSLIICYLSTHVPILSFCWFFTPLSLNLFCSFFGHLKLHNSFQLQIPFSGKNFRSFDGKAR